MAQYKHLSTPDPEWLEFASKMPGPPPEGPRSNYHQRRDELPRMLKQAYETWDPPYPRTGVKIAETTVPLSDSTIKVRTYIPDKTEGDQTRFPLLVWFHGGGFVIGDLELNDPFLRLASVNCRITCVNVDYPLAPEHPFPTAVDYCYAATQWAAANADSLSVDLAKGFIVGGEGSGGNLAAVVALKARDDPSFTSKLSGQILQTPAVILTTEYPEKWKGELLSFEEHKNAPILNRQELDEFMKAYIPDPASPHASPLLATSHANLPPAYLQICGIDMLRDEGFLYDKVLLKSGVPTKLDYYPGHPHAFYSFAPQLTQSKKWREDFQNGIKWLLLTL